MITGNDINDIISSNNTQPPTEDYLTRHPRPIRFADGSPMPNYAFIGKGYYNKLTDAELVAKVSGKVVEIVGDYEVHIDTNNEPDTTDAYDDGPEVKLTGRCPSCFIT